MRKHKPQKIGINPVWVQEYILKPLAIITLVAMGIGFAVIKYNAYATAKAEREEQIRQEQAEQRAEEKRLEKQKELEWLQKVEAEARAEVIKQAEVEKRRTNTLYENEVSKSKVPRGTYLRNDKINKVGKPAEYYGLQIVTNNDWSFELDSNGNMPEEVVMIGYAEYVSRLKKQEEQEKKKERYENANKIKKLLEEEERALTAETKKKLDNAEYIQLEDKKYRIVDIKGEVLTCIMRGERKQKSNYKYLTYSDKMQKITIRDFEIIKK